MELNLDFVQGIAVNSLGMQPNLVKAIKNKKLWHVSNSFIIPEGGTSKIN